MHVWAFCVVSSVLYSHKHMTQQSASSLNGHVVQLASTNYHKENGLVREGLVLQKERIANMPPDTRWQHTHELTNT